MKSNKQPSLQNEEKTLIQHQGLNNTQKPQIPESVRIHIVSLLLNCKKPDQIIEEWDLDCNPPDRSTIYRLKRNVKYNGTVRNKKRVSKEFPIVNEMNKEIVAELLENDDCLSCRELAHITKISKSSIQRILISLEMHFYKFQFVQQLEDCDILKRNIFCMKFCRLHLKTRRRIWFSDECSFPCNGIINRKNSGYYSKKNEHKKIEVSRNQKTVNVWAAICGEGKIVYDIYTGIQNAEKYVTRLKKVFPLMGLETYRFMQDGASIHTADLTLDYLNSNCKKGWIGLKSPWIEFPPYSPDLTPCDFFLWGYLKERVYANSPNSIQMLKHYIETEISDLSPEMIEKACMKVLDLCRECSERGGKR